MLRPGLPLAATIGIAAVAIWGAAQAAPLRTAEALDRALRQARGGETLQLAGADFGVVALRDMRFPTPVKLRAADPAKPPVFGGLDLTGVSGLTFEGLRIVAARPSTPAVSVVRSDHIGFAGLRAEGLLARNPDAVHDGVFIQTSAAVSIVHSELSQFGNGVTHLDCDHLSVRGNLFHDIRVDGVHGGGSSFVTIAGNLFRDFHPLGVVGESGDHADAVQFWTVNTTASAHDIVVSDNLFLRGAGRYAEGVFLNDELKTLPYRRVSITGNLILGGMYNGIFVLHAADVEVRRNVVAGFADRQSYIELLDVEGASVAGNAANELRLSQGVRGAIGENRIVGRLDDGGAALAAAWLARHPDLPRPIVP